MKEITQALLDRFRAQKAERPELRTLQAALAKTSMKELAFYPEAAARLNGDFSLELTTRGITWQKSSGRCWLYAAMNVLRERVAETCNLEMFELSGNYLSFYDKLEKANNFLEQIIAYADKPLTDQVMQYILQGVHDGGYWDMAADLVRKYGVVPTEAMPETWQSTHTEKFVDLYNVLLKKDAAKLRELIAAGGDVQAAKEAMLEEIYRMECVCFGEPPKTFSFEYRDKDNVFHADHNLTGKTFFEKYVGDVLDDYITVTNRPTEGLPLNLLYTFHYIGSMADSDIVSLNLSAEELEELTLKQLQDGEPVWFACDSDYGGEREKGIWDPNTVDYSGLLGGLDFTMPKGDRLIYQASSPTHAMVFVGVNLDENGKPNRWKIENSWGEDAGRKGYFVCSPLYFREYVYEIIVRKKHLTEAQRALLDQAPQRLNPWEVYWL